MKYLKKNSKNAKWINIEFTTANCMWPPIKWFRLFCCLNAWKSKGFYEFSDHFDQHFLSCIGNILFFCLYKLTRLSPSYSLFFLSPNIICIRIINIFSKYLTSLPCTLDNFMSFFFATINVSCNMHQIFCYNTWWINCCFDHICILWFIFIVDMWSSVLVCVHFYEHSYNVSNELLYSFLYYFDFLFKRSFFCVHCYFYIIKSIR